MGNRRTVTLMDGQQQFVLRRLMQVDHWRLQKIKSDDDRFLAAMRMMIISPRLEIEGEPTVDPVDGVVHVLDLSTEDFEMLSRELRDFALGGAQRGKFQASGEPGDAAPALGGGDVRKTAERSGDAVA